MPSNTTRRFEVQSSSAVEVTICDVCPRMCRLHPDQYGWCGVRLRLNGAVAPDPRQGWAIASVGHVEDHPLFHFYPGMRTLNVGSVGCTAACRFCQNWEVALAPKLTPTWSRQQTYSDEHLLEMARLRDCGAISFTFNEAVVWIEGVERLAQQAKAHQLRTILVTNGFLTKHTLDRLSPWLDAIKLDLKGYNDDLSIAQAGIPVTSILETMDIVRSLDLWMEVSSVVVPGVQDSSTAIAAFVNHVLIHAGQDTPWHLQRFFPAYALANQAAGDITDLRRIRMQALAMGLKYVYISNVPGIAERSTRCYRCGQIVASRHSAIVQRLPARCPKCQDRFAGIGLA